jgi:hypothetical protein
MTAKTRQRPQNNHRKGAAKALQDALQHLLFILGRQLKPKGFAAVNKQEISLRQRKQQLPDCFTVKRIFLGSVEIKLL